MLKYVNLHSHTCFSIFDGLGYPADFINFVLNNAGEDSMGLGFSDHGNANSFGYLYTKQKELEQKGIPFKCIYGCEFYYHPDLEKWKLLKKQSDEADSEEELVIENETESKSITDDIKRSNHLLIWAINNEGLKNLYKLISLSNIEGFYRKPRIDFKLLEKYNTGLCLSSACVGGISSYIIRKELNRQGEQPNYQVVLQNSIKIFNEELRPLLDLFPQRSYLELQFNGLKDQILNNLALIKYSEEIAVPLIVTSDAHYPKPQMWRDREIYKALGYQRSGEEINESILNKKEEDLKCLLYPHNGEQIFEAYKKYFSKHYKNEEIIKQAIERTYKIAHEQCERVDPGSKPKLPIFVSTNGQTAFDKLKQLTIEGLKNKTLDKNKKYVDRAIHELKIIKKKEFEQYFLTIKEAVDELKKHILLGPARGSAAGSLVCYVLGITQVDPIKEHLLFERFISDNRKDYPDCDIDVEDRDEAFKILKNYFGENRVVAVTNFSTLQLKSLVKDISKLYNIEFQEVNEVTKVMEDEAKDKIMEEIHYDQKLYEFSFEKAKKYSPTFAKFLEKYPEVGEHIEILFRQNRAISKHAGGIILCNNAIEDMPLIKIRGLQQTPWSEGMAARHLEKFGLIKYDFLGLATLRFIRNCIELILKNRGVNNPTIEQVYKFYDEFLHPDIINKKDEKIFKNIYQSGKFVGTFQFTESRVQGFCVKAKPESVKDISAITALWRPGPLKGKADIKYSDNKDIEIKYDHCILKEVLEETRNTLLYQEQFMILANKLGGFSLDEADELRKLLVKPTHELKDELIEKRQKAREKFIDGCLANGLEKTRSEELWDKEIMGFVSYGFNKSHSVAYAFISYQCSYLLNYFEKEWIEAYLENDTDRDKAINDVCSIGYNLQKPEINQSGVSWLVKDKNIYPSITTIKSIGAAAASEVIRLREIAGQFKDIEHFLYDCIDGKKIWRFSKFNKRSIEALIKCEGFESLGCVGQDKIFKNYRHMHETFVNYFNEIKKGKVCLQELANKVDDQRPWTRQESIQIQKEMLGSFDKSLLFNKEIFAILRDYDVLPLSDLCDEIKLHWFVLKEFHEKRTKNNKKYLQLKISDIDDKMRTVNVFSKIDFELIKEKIYIAPMFLTKEGFINIEFGKTLMTVPDNK